MGQEVKKCIECEHFKIQNEPLKSGGAIWDEGRAACTKYNLVCEFLSHAKLKKLVCTEGREVQ